MKKILIIEDDQIVANIYRNKLATEGFQVEVALDGDAGLSLARSYRPDAIILDLMLPKVSGVDLMKTLRAEPDFKKLPIVVFSNTYLTNLVQEAWKAGATKCLSKANCTPKQVIDVVRNLVGNGAPATGPATATPQPAKPAPGAAKPARLAPPSSMTAHDPDAEFQADLSQSVIESLPSTLGALRTLLQALTKATSELARLQQLHDLYRRVHALTGNAGMAGLHQIAHMSDALEALLKELHEKPKNINASTLRTVAAAIDFLGVLFNHGLMFEQQEPAPANILVVDDEPISRRAVTYAVEKARLKPVAVEDPQLAYTLLTENRFDLIILDVDMPGMNGFELCAKLRNLPRYAKTPVIFVTSLTDFESRANSMMSGGNDFIGKPFLFIELAVKVLVYVLRGRIQVPS